MHMGYFYAIAAAVAWGFVYAVDQRILDKISPSLLILINSIFSIIVLVPILLYSEEFKTIASIDRSTRKFVAISLVGVLIASLLILTAIKHLGSSKAAIFEIAYPFFVVIFSMLFFNTQINGYFLL
ncbi:DMT family transporter [Patescibacteria group bacterium]|nr:DMT family transporter [Patescibacteria group bacterium]